MSFKPTTVGRERDLARITQWEVRVPLSVAIPTDLVGIELNRHARRQILSDEDDRIVRIWEGPRDPEHPGSD